MVSAVRGVEIESRYAEVMGVNTHILSAGDRNGKKLLLIHGVDSNAREAWGSNIASLAETRRVIAMDLPGFGKSGNPSMAPTMEYFVSFMSNFANAEGTERADVVGQSMGGGVAIGYALRNPGAVRTLTVVDPYGLYKIGGVLEHILLMLPEDVSRLFGHLAFGLGKNNSGRFMETVSSMMAAPTKGRSEEGIREALTTARFVESEFTVSEKGGVPHVEFTTDYMGRIKEIGDNGIRSLFIAGGDDPLFSWMAIRRAAGKVEGSSFVEIKEAGHSPQTDDSVRFNELLAKFLAGEDIYRR